MKENEVTSAIINGETETPEQRDALRKAVEATRHDLFATTSEAGLSAVRYGNGRAFKQRPDETEAVLFANARKLVLGLLDKTDSQAAQIVHLDQHIKEMGVNAEQMRNKRDTATAECLTAKAEAEAVKNELAKVAGELAVLLAAIVPPAGTGDCSPESLAEEAVAPSEVSA